MFGVEYCKCSQEQCDDRSPAYIGGDPADQRTCRGSIQDSGESENSKEPQRPEHRDQNQDRVVPVSDSVSKAVIGQRDSDDEVQREDCPDSPGDNVEKLA